MMGKKTFSFKFIDKKKIFHELQKLKSKKASQGSDIPLNIRKTLTSHILFVTISVIHCLVHIIHQIWKMLI